MRSGFLGQLTSGIQPAQLPAPGSTITDEDERPPPEKRIALNAIPGRVFAGTNCTQHLRCICQYVVCESVPNNVNVHMSECGKSVCVRNCASNCYTVIICV